MKHLTTKHSKSTMLMAFGYAFVMLMLFPLAATGQLDEDGWTQLHPENTDKVIYVSSSEGDDASAEVYDFPNNAIGNNPQMPENPVQPFETVEAAEAHIASGDAAWVLFKTGDTFYEEIDPTSGKSNEAPLIYSFYGEGDELPLFKVDSGNAIHSCCGGFAHFWAVGLSFYAHTRNPDDPDYINANGSSGISIFNGEETLVENILIEGCRFRFFESNVIHGWGTLNDIRVRRNVILDNYSTEAHSQGLYSSSVDGILLEGNIFDHNGWYKQSEEGDNDKSEGQATMFNHDTYFSGTHNAVFQNNSFYRPSSIGTKWTANDGEASSSNLTITNNLYYDFEIGISIGGNDTDPPYRFKNISFTENILSAAGNIHPTNRSLGWNIEIDDWDNGQCSRNYIIHQQKDDVTNGKGISITGENRSVRIDSNILYNLKHTQNIRIGDAAFSDVSFEKNEITKVFTGLFLRTDQHYTLPFTENSWASDHGFEETFRLAGDYTNFADWSARAHVNDNSTEQIAYYEPERSLELYVDRVLGLSDMEAYYASLRQQSMLNWREEYTAPVINAWIKEGFEKIITSVSKTEDKNNALFYPNPVQRELYIDDEHAQEVIISDMNGKSIAQKEVSNKSITVDALPHGVYIMKALDQSGRTITRQLILKQ